MNAPHPPGHPADPSPVNGTPADTTPTTPAYPRGGGPAVTGRPDLPAVETAVLEFWKADDTFRAALEQGGGNGEFVFYDGPPFANGLPHYGHLLTGYVKDLIPRYKTMRGYQVQRRFGWDTHGLPAELEAERQLGIKGRGEILDLGVDVFNEACRESVLRYTNEWREYVTRQARWVDFDHDYKTLDLTFMESVLWAFRTLYDKGLLYEGQRVLPYCWVDETPLSNHELRMDDDVYQPRQDPSVTVWVGIDVPGVGVCRLLAWTTTPWTLPSNLAMAVGPDLDYVVVGSGGDRYVLAEARLSAYARELGEDAGEHVVRRLKGAELLGLTYTPPFDFLTDAERFGTGSAFRVIAADHVTTEDGTGVVHMAPAYGEEDQKACEAVGIPTIVTVDDRARFTALVPPYAGMQVFEANPFVIDDLKKSGCLLRRETYTHSYPHCWRCRNPLIYKAVSSWFVEVTAIKDRMVELNQQITWVPEHIKDGQFGKWLANARDWSISRNRFWGSPIPVWKSDDPNHPRTDVYGSLDELERDFGVRPTDLHRPGIDELTRPNPDDPTGRSTMRRVTDVLDVWFDSGSMPFAQVHHPFENRAWFESHFPADFIVEYIGQTRGWFYTLHVLATALFDKPAFTTCVSHGIVLGDDGAKMSKSLQNYPDVGEVFARDGSDAMRWFLMSSPILRGGNLVVTEEGIREGVRQALLPLWNAWYFLALYANAAGVAGTVDTSSTDLLDRFVLAAVAELRDELTTDLDAYDVAGACVRVRNFLELLTNWYIRRSRARFWAGDRAAVNTLHTVLETLCRLCAPLLPLAGEHIWRGLTGGRSVHLTTWPDGADLPRDADLLAAMAEVREVASVALSLRKAAAVRTRQPLSLLTVTTVGAQRLRPFAGLLAEEVNVQRLELDELAEGGTSPVRRQLVVNARAAGPRLGRSVQQVIAAAKAGDFNLADDGSVTCGGVALQPGEYTVELLAAAGAGAVGVLRSGGFVRLDLDLTDELVDEGVVRDVVRAVQDVRKALDLDVSDRISLTVTTPSERVLAALRARLGWLSEQVLAPEPTVRVPEPPAAVVPEPPAVTGPGTAHFEVGHGFAAPVSVTVGRR